jgi:hypothetical protein
LQWIDAAAAQAAEVALAPTDTVGEFPRLVPPKLAAHTVVFLMTNRLSYDVATLLHASCTTMVHTHAEREGVKTEEGVRVAVGGRRKEAGDLEGA